MTKDESKRLILREWEKRAADPNKATYDEKQKFYWWLVENRPQLLRWEIRAGMDRSQDVQAWLDQRTQYGGVYLR